MRRTVVVAAFFCSLMARADEIWVLRGQTLPQCPASTAVWRADALLMSPPDTATDVQVLDVSNGGAAEQPLFALIPGRAISLGFGARDHAPAVVWITHVQVPPGTIVDGRLTYFTDDCRGIPAPLEPSVKVQTPIFRALVPAAVRQVHTGSDLGAQDARVNVGIYNDGTVPAEALIVVRRPNCDGAPTEKHVTIPPRSLIQDSLNPPTPCSQAGLMFPGSYTITEVTVSEPSLTYAVALSNGTPPGATIGFGSPH